MKTVLQNGSQIVVHCFLGHKFSFCWFSFHLHFLRIIFFWIKNGIFRKIGKKIRVIFIFKKKKLAKSLRLCAFIDKKEVLLLWSKKEGRKQKRSESWITFWPGLSQSCRKGRNQKPFKSEILKKTAHSYYRTVKKM